MQNEINQILANKKKGSLINKETTFKIVVGEEVIDMQKPGFDVMASDYFFELWVNDTYSFHRKINNDYKDEILQIYKAGWETCGNDIYNQLIDFNGNLDYCLKHFEEVSKDQLDDFELMKSEGFDSLTMNYKHIWLTKLFQGYKAKFIFNSLIYRIIEKENCLFNKVNIETVKTIAELWSLLIHHPKLKINKLSRLHFLDRFSFK